MAFCCCPQMMALVPRSKRDPMAAPSKAGPSLPTAAPSPSMGGVTGSPSARTVPPVCNPPGYCTPSPCPSIDSPTCPTVIHSSGILTIKKDKSLNRRSGRQGDNQLVSHESWVPSSNVFIPTTQPRLVDKLSSSECVWRQ